MCIYIYIYMYVCMYVCMYIYIYIYIYMFLSVGAGDRRQLPARAPDVQQHSGRHRGSNQGTLGFRV